VKASFVGAMANGSTFKSSLTIWKGIWIGLEFSSFVVTPALRTICIADDPLCHSGFQS